MTFKFFVIFLIGASAHAAIIRNLDDTEVIEVPISQSGLTRITVKEDRILNVFGVAGEYDLEADEDQGQIFIRPLVRGNESAGVRSQTISLTLTTEGGNTQDLCLVPKDKKPEALILKKEEEGNAIGSPINRLMTRLSGNDYQLPIMRDEVEDLIHASLEDRIPLGYTSVSLDLKTLRGPHHLVREIRGEKLRCLTYQVKNTSSKPLILSETEFATSPDVVAVLIANKTLKLREGTTVYVVVRTL